MIAAIVVLGIVIIGIRTSPHRSPKAVVQAYIGNLAGEPSEYGAEEMLIVCRYCDVTEIWTDLSFYVGVPSEEELTVGNYRFISGVAKVIWGRYGFVVERHFGRWYVACVSGDLVGLELCYRTY